MNSLEQNERVLSTADRPVILVADDDRLVVATLSRGLRSAGYPVIEAYDCATALSLCAERSPGLALVDYKMPEMTGVELVKRMATPAIPVVFLSAYGDCQFVAEAIAAGAMSYLVKPIDTGQLLPIIRSALERAHELGHLRTELKESPIRNRAINVATGLLMGRLHLTQKEAAKCLRRLARSKRLRLEDVANELVRISEDDTRIYDELSESRVLPGRPHDEGQS